MQRYTSSTLALGLVAAILAGCPADEKHPSSTNASAGAATGAASAAPATSGAATPAASPAHAASGAAVPDKAASSVAVANPKARFVAKGIYLTATQVELQTFKGRLQKLKAAGGNTIVFDAKDEDGIVQWKSSVPLAKKINAYKEGPIGDLRAKIKLAHDLGIHVAGRVCCFHDPILAHKMPELCPKHVHGGIWKEVGQQVWVDPSKQVAQDYAIDLGKELASLGCDEVQFDYIRFPAYGDTQNARYAFDMKKTEKHEIIRDFLKRAYGEIHATGALVSCDVYGIMAWEQPIDIKITGQKMAEMALYTDVICPMDYPSHFQHGFDGIANPADQPYVFVDKAMGRLHAKIGGTGVVIRPWLQGMSFRVSNFTPHYVVEELKAAQKNHGVGYMMWNAQNTYDTAFAGMAQFEKVK